MADDWVADPERKAFDDTKAGVKGLVDAGVTKIPQMFVSEKAKLVDKSCPRNNQISIPVIDLEDIDKDASLRGKIVEKVRDACKNLGLFQIVNHGIPVGVMWEMIEGVRRFNEQETEVKKQYYSHDRTRKFVYGNTFLFSRQEVNWKDTFACVMAPHPHPPNPDELPVVCREYNGLRFDTLYSTVVPEEKEPVFVTMFNPLSTLFVAVLSYFALGENALNYLKFYICPIIQYSWRSRGYF